MDTFKDLSDDAANIVERLRSVASNYPTHSEWTWDRTFEETKKDLDQIKMHFEKEAVVESNLKDDIGIKDVLSEAEVQRNDIASVIDSILMLHVDESGFEEALKAMANKMKAYYKYCEESYYPELQKHLSKDDMKHIQDQLINQSVPN